jgi:hypothetical protein
MDDEKQQLDQTIEGARDRVGDRIDELDRRIRKRLDIKSIASEHAPQLVAGGAVVGFLVGFGFPKVIKRVLQIAIPVAIIAVRVNKMRGTNGKA